jgi:hypothetical protein
MKSKTKVWTAALAATMVSIVLAVVVSRTTVSPQAIELSVIHADDAIERAWTLPAPHHLGMRFLGSPMHLFAAHPV